MGKKHSTFSPSAAERWLSCPASIELSKGVPQPPPSKYAIEGTEAHGCLEYFLRRISHIDPATIKEAEFFWNRSMVKYALEAVEEIIELRPDSDYAELLIEQRVKLKSDERCYGTLDSAWVDLWNRLVIMDYKYGQGHAVDVISLTGELNPQLMIYATAVAEEYDFAFGEVELVIIQPRAREKVPQRITVPMDAVREFRDSVLIPGIAETQRANAPVIPGDHCRWCPAKNQSCFAALDTDSQPYVAEESIFDFE